MSAAVTIGNFDGVHRGHAALLRAARALVDGPVVAVTFEPHPMRILDPPSAPARVSTSAQRREWLQEAGADEVVELPLTRAFLAQEPREFLATIVERFQPAAIVEGRDFRFGYRRAGDISLLQSLGADFGYRTLIVPPVEVALSDQTIVAASSSMTRWLLERGRVRDAGAVLGRPFELRAVVAKGDQRGRSIGFPTANLLVQDQILPADGVYAGLAMRDGDWRPAAISVGDKPTFAGRERVCEAFLLDYAGPVDDYGWEIRLTFTDWVRDQVRFDSVDALVAQLKRDVQRVESLTESMRMPT